MGFAAGAVGGGLHNTTRGWGGGVLVVAPCRWGSSVLTTMAAPREVAGGGVIELLDWMGTVRFVRFTDRIAGSTNPIPIQPLYGLIDQIGPEL